MTVKGMVREMKQYLAYPAVFEEQEGIYYVTFPDFPELTTEGEGIADAMLNGQKVLREAIRVTGAPEASDIHQLMAENHGRLINYLLAEYEIVEAAEESETEVELAISPAEETIPEPEAITKVEPMPENKEETAESKSCPDQPATGIDVNETLTGSLFGGSSFS